MVASDRISAYDHVLASEIPDKGRILTQLSLWWFDQLGVEHHVLASTVEGGVPAAVEGRAMICKKLDMFPVECIARGYLTGSGLAEYRQSGTVCSIPLPEGLVDGSRLDEAIFTPSAKAEVGEHDENITYDAVVDMVGDDIAARLQRADPGDLHQGRGDRPRPRHHPGGHQGGVRLRRRHRRHHPGR